jgi:hypothetical protein
MTAMRVMRLPPVSTVELDNLIRSPFGAGEQRQRDSRPSVFAVLRLITKLVLGRCLYCRLAGFSPLRMRST